MSGLNSEPITVSFNRPLEPSGSSLLYGLEESFFYCSDGQLRGGLDDQDRSDQHLHCGPEDYSPIALITILTIVQLDIFSSRKLRLRHGALLVKPDFQASSGFESPLASASTIASFSEFDDGSVDSGFAGESEALASAASVDRTIASISGGGSTDCSG